MTKVLYPMLCYYPSEVGGPANSVYRLNKATGKLGIKSIIISTRYGIKNPIINHEKIYTIFNINVFFVSGSIASFFKRVFYGQIREADIIHFSSLFFKPTIFYTFLALLFSKRVIISPRGELYPAALSKSAFIKRIYIFLFKLIQRKIEFHSTNGFETGLIKKKFKKAKSIIEIPNFIEVPALQMVARKKQFLFIGRINPIKNIDILIKAFFNFRNSKDYKPDYNLVIAGEAILDYEKKYFAELNVMVQQFGLADNVSFIGGVFGTQKTTLIKESMCLILPSKSENFGNVVLESISLGTPAIVSDQAPWEVLETRKAGFWVEPTIEELSNSLVRIVNLNENSYIKLCENAYNLALTDYDINKSINKWVDFYRPNLTKHVQK